MRYARLKPMKRNLLLLAAFLAGWPLHGQDSSLPTLIVKPLDGDLSQVQGWQPALGEGLAEMLVTDLSRLNKFELLESSALKDLKDEIDMGDAGYVGKEEKVDKGGWKGADFLFYGKVTRFGSNTKGADLSGFVPRSVGSLGVERTKNDVQIDWRLTDIATRRILKTGRAIGTHTGVGFNVGANVQGSGGLIGYHNQDFMNSALGKATVLAVSNIVAQVAAVSVPASGRRQAKEKAAVQQIVEQQKAVEQATAAQQEVRQSARGKVLAVPSKGVLIISLGSNQGFKPGDKLRLLESILTKDDQGNTVFEEEKEAGEVVLQAVQEDRSKAAYEGSQEARIGWIVRGK